LFVALPTLCVTAYIFFYATPRYVSEFQAIYHSNDSQMQSSVLGGLLGGSGSVDMNAAVVAYLQSPSVLAEVDKQLDLKRKFSDPSIDWLDRLSAGAAMETFVTYFQRRVSAFENSSGYVVVDAEGFSPSEAKQLAQALANSAERMVASISQREKLDMVKFTEDEVQRYEREYLAAVDRLTEFREEHRDYDFSGSEQLLTGTVGALESQLAQLRSQLASSRKFLGDDAPTVAVIKSQIAATDSQIADEQARLASPVRPKTPTVELKGSRKLDPSGAARLSDSLESSAGSAERPADNDEASRAPYSQLLATYFKLSQDQQFATALLQTAKLAAESARLEAGKQSAYMFAFVPPNLPERSIEPSPTRYILTTFVACILAYFGLSILFGLFRHEAGA
jgi:capsular polysaccharide transport system permease protein